MAKVQHSQNYEKYHKREISREILRQSRRDSKPIGEFKESLFIRSYFFGKGLVRIYIAV